MVRPLRIQYENAYYHIMNRGKGRQVIYPNQACYKAFLQCLEESHQRFGIEILGYCLMSNHYHLLIKTPNANISRAMRHINGVYTQRYNWLQKTDGPLFRGRYKSILIEASSYLLQVSRYIHRNPIETRKPMVERLEEYPWSSYPSYIHDTKVEEWLCRDDIYGEQGGLCSHESYRLFVERGNDREITEFYKKEDHGSILGGKGFIKASVEKVKSWDLEVSRKGLKSKVTMDDVIDKVSGYFQCDRDQLLNAKRGARNKNNPRRIAMKLCQDFTGCTLVEIARLFNVGHHHTVCQTIRRLKEELDKDSELEEVLNVICLDLTP